MKFCGKCIATSETVSRKKWETVEKQKDIWVSGKLPPLPQLLPVPTFIPSSYKPYELAAASLQSAALVQIQTCPSQKPETDFLLRLPPPKPCKEVVMLHLCQWYLGLALACCSDGKLRALSEYLVISLAVLNSVQK